jgi:hypothetical protein
MHGIARGVGSAIGEDTVLTKPAGTKSPRASLTALARRG